VVQAPAKLTENVRVEPDRLCFPLELAAEVKKLKPGAPLIGKPAPTHARRRKGGSNNVLGFVRKVKEIKEENGEVVVVTEPAGLADVVIGAANVQFGSQAKELDIGDEVDIAKILPDLPPQVSATVQDLPEPPAQQGGDKGAGGAEAGFGAKQGPLTWLDADLKLGVGFGGSYTSDVLSVDTADLGPAAAAIPYALKLKANAKAMLAAKFNAAARLAVTVESTWTNPLPHLTYFFAGAMVEAAIEVALDLAIKFDITIPVGKAEEKEKDEARKALADTPIKNLKGFGSGFAALGNDVGANDEFTIGKTKYFEGPVIVGIPTVFAFNVVGKCMFNLYGDVEASASAKVAFGGEFGVEYAGGNWGFKGATDFEKKFTWNLKHVSGGATMTCTIGPRLDWLFAGVGGPFLSPKLGLRGGAKYQTVCPNSATIPDHQQAKGKVSANIDVGVIGKLGVGVDLKVINFATDFSLVENWWTLWENAWPIDPGFGICKSLCKDGILSGKETDVDCGGKSGGGGCFGCEYGKVCKTNQDCNFAGSKVTCQGGKCGNLNCVTGKQEDYMTDVNCGALCASAGYVCEVGKKCKVNADCESDNCDFGLCGPQKCDNGVHDWWETGVDCGGKYCKPCAHGEMCKNDKDCPQDHVCRGNWTSTSPFFAIGACVPASCDLDKWWTQSDFGKKPGMTDEMCGGVCARVLNYLPPEACHYGKFNLASDKTCGLATVKCGKNKVCEQDGDCLSNACFEGKCIELDCKDGKQQQWETGVDCGGKCPYKCKIDGGCKTSSDCEYGAPCVKSVVGQGNVCSLCDANGKLDGWEADVDCGAQCAGGKANFELCKLGQKCSSSADCATGYKTNFQGQEIVVDGVGCFGGKCGLSCFNNQWDDKTETDVDCGGTCKAKCGKDKKCKSGNDCESGGCLAGTCAGKCFNGKKDDDEGGIDCGGICTTKCALQKGCKADGDCKSGSCDGAQCVATACETKKQDGDETGVDCGGTCSQACDNGQGCALAKDCASTYCAAVSLACVATPCLDEVKNGAETDVDCGGAVCAGKCATGKGCKVGGDCKSGFCNAGTGKCVATSCEDGVKSGDEAGQDCGGSCGSGCKDGSICGKDGDCLSGLCSTTTSNQKICGCPPYTRYIKVNSATKAATCAMDFFALPESYCGQVGDGSVLQCNNNGFQISKAYFGLAGGTTYPGAVAGCDGLQLGGFDDWRMATAGEMLSLFNWDVQSNSLPSKPKSPLAYPINVNTGTFAVWTATTISPPFPGYNSSNVHTLQPSSPLIVDTWGWTKMLPLNPNAASPATLPSFDKRDMVYFCARWPYSTAPTLPNPRFSLMYNGQVVKDNWTNRMWYRTKYTQNNGSCKSAIDYCKSVNVGGLVGWKLPTMWQLLSISDVNRKTPPYWDTDLFPAVDQPGAANQYSGESFFTLSPLCNNTNVETGQGCPYSLNPYDLATTQAWVNSALCVLW